MVGLLGSVVGGTVLVVLILVGIWLTWLSLQGESNRPKALQVDEAEPPD